MDQAFLRGLPKAELHIHLEGSFEPELMFAIAKRNRIAIPFASVEDVRAAYQFTNLQDFLDIYYQGAGVLKEEEDFYDLTLAYLKRAAEDGVRHVEAFFDPQTHTNRGIPMYVVVNGIMAAFADGKVRYGISAHLILCFLRHLSEQAAFDTLKMAEPYLDKLIGVGLDSSERAHPPEKFQRVFARAGAMGLRLVAHAGEEGPADYVEQALDLLKVDRLDHGNRALENPALVQRLATSGMTLTVCPLSNLKLRGVENLKVHPLKKMLRAGLRATVNSDDPAYFGGYVTDNFVAVSEALNLTQEDAVKLAENSFRGSFLPPAEVEKHLADVQAYAKKHIIAV